MFKTALLEWAAAVPPSAMEGKIYRLEGHCQNARQDELEYGFEIDLGLRML